MRQWSWGVKGGPVRTTTAGSVVPNYELEAGLDTWRTFNTNPTPKTGRRMEGVKSDGHHLHSHNNCLPVDLFKAHQPYDEFVNPPVNALGEPLKPWVNFQDSYQGMSILNLDVDPD